MDVFIDFNRIFYINIVMVREKKRYMYVHTSILFVHKKIINIYNL